MSTEGSGGGGRGREGGYRSQQSSGGGWGTSFTEDTPMTSTSSEASGGWGSTSTRPLSERERDIQQRSTQPDSDWQSSQPTPTPPARLTGANASSVGRMRQWPSMDAAAAKDCTVQLTGVPLEVDDQTLFLPLERLGADAVKDVTGHSGYVLLK